MAIYHFDVKVISRGSGRSAVAAAAYMSSSAILNDYDGVQHDYTRKRGLVWEHIFLPDNAPAAWAERAVLWNAVEEGETGKDARLAREFVAALPVELNHDEQIALLTEFIQQQFVALGMCADVAVHDTDGHNPHAHIMLTIRPLDEAGAWQYKTEKEYLCVRDGEERGFTAAEFRTAQAEGWEKQYLYKVGKKKEYLPSSAAGDYERTSKYPKCTKHGRQNPISAQWNSEPQLSIWREAWADTINRHLEQAGFNDRVDHRSHAERGLDEQPTIHEGVAARMLEKSGGISERCELNRMIRADNALLRELKALVKKLSDAVAMAIDKIAEKLEIFRTNLIILCYQRRYSQRYHTQLTDWVNHVRKQLDRYNMLTQQIKAKQKTRKALQTEHDDTLPINVIRRGDLKKQIAAVTEELEELKSERRQVMDDLDCIDAAAVTHVPHDIADREEAIEKTSQRMVQLTGQIENTLHAHDELLAQVNAVDMVAVAELRNDIRAAHEQIAIDRAQAAYQERYDPQMMRDSQQEAASMLKEETEPVSVRERLKLDQQKTAHLSPHTLHTTKISSTEEQR